MKLSSFGEYLRLFTLKLSGHFERRGLAGDPLQQGNGEIYESCARVGGLANNVRIVRGVQEFVRNERT